MGDGGGPSLHREHEIEWFRRSAGLFESLSACCGIVESILVGLPTANLVAAKELSGPIRAVESVLAEDPCPDPWGARQLASVVATLTEVRTDVVLAFGEPVGAEQVVIHAKAASARRMVTELERLANRLLSGEGVTTSPG